MASYLPLEWDDEERMRVLMGAIPVTAEKVSINSRFTFWRSSLLKWCEHNNDLTFTLKDAEFAFQRGSQLPKCFPEVFKFLVKEGVLISPEDLVVASISETDTWVSWGTKAFISKPTKWIWNSFQMNILGTQVDSQFYIHSHVLRNRADSFLSSYWSLPKDSCPQTDPENLISVDVLYCLMKTNVCSKIDDFILLLQYLTKTGKVVMINHRNSLMVKIAKPGQTGSLTIDKAEIAEYDLRSSHDKLVERIGKLEDDVSNLRTEAKMFVSLGHKAKALSLLRRKKMLESCLGKSYMTLENVTHCITNLEQSKLNVDVLNSFQSGISALRSSLSSGDAVSRASSTMDSLQDLLEDCKDVGDTLAFGFDSLEICDDDQLESELRQMLLDQDHEQLLESPNNDTELNLPDVPQCHSTANSQKMKKNPAQILD